MKERINRLLSKLDEKSLDSIVVTDRNNIRYLSGFTGTTSYLVISHAKRYLVTDFRYVEQAEKQCGDFEIIDIKKTDVKKLVSDMKHTGFENETILFAEYKKFSEIFSSLEPVDNMLTLLRSVKDENEIKNIKKAIQIADDAFSHVVKIAKSGMSEKDLADEIEFYMKKHGASSLSFDTIAASGARGAMPHGFPTDKKIENGELVVLDFGCFYNGYASDMTRTVAVGEVSKEQIDIYNTVKEAQKRATEEIGPGKKCADIHMIAQNTINEKYPDSFGHALGHGVGLEIHEMPTLSPLSKLTLVPGNVVSVEPGIYIQGFCGVRIEDLVLITNKNCEILTKSTKDLIYIA